MHPDPRPVSISYRLYRALLTCYPAPFRREYGREMTLLFRDQCRARYRQQGSAGLLRLWCSTVLDLLTTVPHEYLEEMMRFDRRGLSARRWLFLMLQAVAALYLSLVIPRGLEGMGLTGATMTALQFQTVLLALALSLPLRRGDLNLSIGLLPTVGVMILITLSPPYFEQSPSTVARVLPAALCLAGGVGALWGLLHGVMAVRLRLPVGSLTLATGLALMLLLARLPVRHQLALYGTARLNVREVSLLLCVMMLLLLVYLARRSDRSDPPSPSLARPRAWWRSPWQRVIVIPATATGVLIMGLLNMPSFDALGLLLLVPPVTVLFLLLGTFLQPYLLGWFLYRPTEDRGRTFYRILALAFSSGVATVVGVLMAAQGVRDGGLFSFTSWSVFVPLAGLLVGGYHRLQGWQRLGGGVVGSIATAAFCLSQSQPSDNLAPGALMAVVLAVLVLAIWRWLDGAPVAAPQAGEQEEELDRSRPVLVVGNR